MFHVEYLHNCMQPEWLRANDEGPLGCKSAKAPHRNLGAPGGSDEAISYPSKTMFHVEHPSPHIPEVPYRNIVKD